MSPADIARQTLIQLAKRSLPPTPENYENTYNEIAGIKDNNISSLSQTLRKVLTNASKSNTLNSPTEKAITTAIKKQDWAMLET